MKNTRSIRACTAVNRGGTARQVRVRRTSNPENVDCENGYVQIE